MTGTSGGVPQPRHKQLAARPFVAGICGALLMWLALPPWGHVGWPLAWVAPVPWLLLIRRNDLSGRRPYTALWFSGFVFWLLAVHWIRLPHPANYIAWLALSSYLACYLPTFVLITRIAVHGWRLSIVVAAPVVWTGLELARAHLFTGFPMAMLSHTQYEWIALIQISDLGGAYAVSFVVMLVAACLARMLPLESSRAAVWPTMPAVLALGSALLYGHIRLRGVEALPGPRVALIQESIDADWKADLQKTDEVMRRYIDLSLAAARSAGKLDLVVWPETMFRYRLRTEDDAGVRRYIADLVAQLGAPVLLGIERVEHGNLDREDHFNSAACTDRSGRIIDVYDKMHLVMFGEYVPWGDKLPWIERLMPMGSLLTAGNAPKLFQLGEVGYAPSICYENVLPHLIRSQVNTFRQKGQPIDVLVNLTNDAWFWGSSELDMHLSCGVFRAVECRMPMLIAANGGLSASIDADGRIQLRGPRRKPKFLVANVKLDRRSSWYLAAGDWLAGTCLAFTAGIGLGPAIRRWILRGARGSRARSPESR